MPLVLADTSVTILLILTPWVAHGHTHPLLQLQPFLMAQCVLTKNGPATISFSTVFQFHFNSLDGFVIAWTQAFAQDFWIKIFTHALQLSNITAVCQKASSKGFHVILKVFFKTVNKKTLEVTKTKKQTINCEMQAWMFVRQL